MTTDNIQRAIDRALAHKPGETLPRVSKTEAEHIVSAAEQGAGPEPLLESVWVAAFVVGAEQARSLVDGAEVELPAAGTPGVDYVIDESALEVFDRFFRRHLVPLGGARDAIVAEMSEQLLALGKGRARPDTLLFRVDLEDSRGERYVGWIDPKERAFFVEQPGASRRGESLFYGAFRLDGRPDRPRR